MRLYVFLLAILVAWLTLELGGEKPLPPGWRWTSERPDTANCGAFQGERPTLFSSRSISLRCTTAEPGFAAARFAFPVENYRGKIVTLFAEVKVSDVSDYSNLWIRADRDGDFGAQRSPIEENQLKGSTGWVTVTRTIRVPADATVLMTGVILFGKGTISITAPQLMTRKEPTDSSGKTEGEAQGIKK